jgi:hypothetical protein
MSPAAVADPPEDIEEMMSALGYVTTTTRSGRVMNESRSSDSKHGKSMPLGLARTAELVLRASVGPAELVLRAPVGPAELVFRTAVRAAELVLRAPVGPAQFVLRAPVGTAQRVPAWLICHRDLLGKRGASAAPATSSLLRLRGWLNRGPAGQLAGVTIPYSWILR